MRRCNIDKRICDCEDALNNQTYREYITETECVFELPSKNIDNISNSKLNEYLSFLDDLWLK